MKVQKLTPKIPLPILKINVFSNLQNKNKTKKILPHLGNAAIKSFTMIYFQVCIRSHQNELQKRICL